MRQRDASNPILSSGERNALAALRSQEGDTERKSLHESMDSDQVKQNAASDVRSQSQDTIKGQDLRRLTLERMQARIEEKKALR